MGSGFDQVSNIILHGFSDLKPCENMRQNVTRMRNPLINWFRYIFITEYRINGGIYIE